MKKLIIIPARGGSKGIPKKNLKEFNGVPLIKYTMDFARKNFPEDEICVSTDSDEIIQYVESNGLKVPFKRPSVFASDTSSSRDVILHALEFYKNLHVSFDYVVLLQPTSPIRNDDLARKANEIINLNTDVEMVVSVRESKANPYFNLFEEDEFENLKKSKPGHFTRRQDCPAVYEYTGAFYLIKSDSILHKPMHEFSKIKKIVISNPAENIDLDTPNDWLEGEFILTQLYNN